jgi:hypothetical protein
MALMKRIFADVIYLLWTRWRPRQRCTPHSFLFVTFGIAPKVTQKV